MRNNIISIFHTCHTIANQIPSTLCSTFYLGLGGENVGTFL